MNHVFDSTRVASLGARLGALALAALATASLTAAAQQRVAIGDLGNFSAEFADVGAVTERPGAAVMLRVDALPGDRLQLHLPFEPNRLEPLVADGSHVRGGDTVARIAGPALGQWLLEAELLRARFAEAETRYQRNRPLYEEGALAAGSWLAISEHYRALRLEMHHAEHVMELLAVEERREPAEAMLRAPGPGILLFAAPGGAAGDHPTIAELVAVDSLRLSAWTGTGDSEAPPRSISVGECRLPVARQEQAVSGFRRRIWSEPLDGCLPAQPGLLRSGRVNYAFDGYRVPRSAVMRHGRDSLVAVRRDAQLLLVPVHIRGDDGSGYYVTADTALRGEQVLVRSNSALQGLLMGLGGLE